MPLDTDLFVAPRGDLTADLFTVGGDESYASPYAKMVEYVFVWAEQAAAETDAAGDPLTEAAQAAYVRWRAATYVADRYATEASSASAAGVSVSYDLARAQATWRAKADAAKEALDGATGAAVAAPRSVVLARTPVWT